MRGVYRSGPREVPWCPVCGMQAGHGPRGGVPSPQTPQERTGRRCPRRRPAPETRRTAATRPRKGSAGPHAHAVLSPRGRWEPAAGPLRGRGRTGQRRRHGRREGVNTPGARRSPRKREPHTLPTVRLHVPAATGGQAAHDLQAPPVLVVGAGGPQARHGAAPIAHRDLQHAVAHRAPHDPQLTAGPRAAVQDRVGHQLGHQQLRDLDPLLFEDRSEPRERGGGRPAGRADAAPGGGKGGADGRHGTPRHRSEQADVPSPRVPSRAFRGTLRHTVAIRAVW